MLGELLALMVMGGLIAVTALAIAGFLRLVD
jgi:hypothetical protein